MRPSFGSRLGFWPRLKLVPVFLLAVTIGLLGVAINPASAQQLTLIPDTGGYDQIDQGNGAQQDITGVAIDGATFSFAWDEPALSGANSSDACSYFLEADGTVTSVCYSVEFNNDQYITEFEIYDCGTTYGNGKCTGNNPVSTEYSVTCGDPSLVDPYFAEDPDPDLQASCTIAGLGGNDPTALKFVNTCTKPSQSPSSLSNDCIFDPGEPDPGFLQLVKSVADGSAQPADFTLTAVGAASTVTGAGQTDLVAVPTGDYTLSETSALLDDGTYQLDSIFCVTEDGAPVDESDGVVAVAELSTTICTFTNSLALLPPEASVIKGAEAGNDTVATISEPGGSVTIPVSVTNTGGDAILTSLTDVPYGDITQVQGSVTATTCAIGQTIASGDTYTCEFTVDVDSQPGTVNDTVTATLNNTQGTSTATDEANVIVKDVPSAIEVIKTPSLTSIDEPGGTVTFSFVVNNLSTVDSVTIDTLNDSIYGDLNTQGDCAVPQTIAAGGSYTCSFSTFVSATETNVVTGSGLDDDGHAVSDDDEATVTITDVTSSISVEKTANPTSVPETGADVDYTVVITNTSAVDDVTIDTFVDDLATTAPVCDPAIGSTLAPGESITCTYTEFVSGDAGETVTNTVTVSGTDDDGGPVGGGDTADVVLTDVLPDVSISKTANPTSVDEPGADVEFTIVVTNDSAEDATVDSLTDSDFDLSVDCADAVGTVLAQDESYTCVFTRFVAGNFREDHRNTATVAVSDGDGNTDTASDTADVTVENVPSAISLVKTASPTSVPESGADVTFTFEVTNDSAVDTVTINGIEDTVYGAVGGRGDCAFDQVLAPTESYSCSFTVRVFGQPGTPHLNVATASGVDDDGNAVSATDEATVTFINEPATIEVTKTANPTTIAEPGGDVVYTFEVTNTSAYDTVTIDSLIDTPYGDLDGVGTCATGTELAVAGEPGDTYACEATFAVSGNPGDIIGNRLDVSGTDDDGDTVTGDDTADVTIADVPSSILVTKTSDLAEVPETGADVTYTVEIANTSAVDDVTITTVDDDLAPGAAASCLPALPADLAPGESITCTYTEFVSGDFPDTVTNTVTVAGTDDDGGPVGGGDTADVDLTDVLPDVSISKTANPTSVDEPGADVEFTIVVTNDSAEDATVDSLGDSDFDLSVDCADAVGTVLAQDETYTCVFTRFVAGNFDEDHQNTATVVASDDDGNTDTASDNEDVTINGVAPVIIVDKSGEATINEGGDTATYTITITNDSVDSDPVTVTSLTDDKFGDLLAEAEAANGGAPIVIAPGDSFSFDFDRELSLDAGEPHTNVATACADDDEGIEDCDDDDHVVTGVDVAPVVEIVKDGPATINEGGDSATYSFVITNNSVDTDPLTVTSLTDDKFGDLLAEAEAANGDAAIVIQSGDSFSFSISRDLTLDVGQTHTNVVTVVATDNEGTTATDDDDHVVGAVDVAPVVEIVKSGDPTVDEGGGTVSYDFVITNNSVDTDPLTVTSLTDDKFGELLAEAEAANGGSIVLDAGESFGFSISRELTLDGGVDHINVVTVVGVDDEGSEATDNDDHVVAGVDVAPIISVQKDVDQQAVFAPGEDVTFTVTITNDSVSTDPVTVASFGDDIHTTAVCANGDGDIVGQTIQPGESLTCSFTVLVDGDETDTVTIVATDDDGTDTDPASDTATVEMVNPAITVEKSTGPADADTPPGPEILVGETVSWFYQVTNTGDVTLENVAVVDDQGVVVTCPTSTLIAGSSTVCTGSGTSTEGQYANIGTVSASYTDADGDVANRSDADPSHYFGAAPSVDITKAFTDDSVIAGGGSGTFVLVATNDGNVDLDAVSITDSVDPRLIVSGITVTGGNADCAASAGQNLDCSTDLAVGESVEITVTYSVDASTAEANGAGGVNDEPAVSNTATVSDDYTDALGNGTTVTDEASDSVDIDVDIELTTVKTFSPDAVPQGTAQSFTIAVTNSGPSDAVDVSVTDLVDASLEVTGATVTTGTGNCDATSGQLVDCTVQLPVGETAIVTVDYITAPFFDENSPYGTQSGDDFRFVFANGSVLEGSTDGGPVFLDGEDITDDVTIVPSITKNDVIFDPDGAGPEPAIELHLSCSDPFTGGWGQSAGPVEGVNSPDWQIAFFAIARFQNGDFRKSCGNVTNPYQVDNTATADGEDSFGAETAQGSDSVTVEPGITLNRLQTNGRRVTARLTNFTGEDKVIAEVEVQWPNSNSNLNQVRVDDTTVWSGTDAPPSTVLDASVAGWNGGTLATGDAILRFDFDSRSARSGYAIRLTFTDGTFLDITA